jgi:nucleoside permease NupC
MRPNMACQSVPACAFEGYRHASTDFSNTSLREWRLTWETSHHTVSRQIYVIYVFNRFHWVSSSMLMQYVTMSLPSGGFCIALYMSTVCTWLSLAAFTPASKEMLRARAQLKLETLKQDRNPLCTDVYRSIRKYWVESVHWKIYEAFKKT